MQSSGVDCQGVSTAVSGTAVVPLRTRHSTILRSTRYLARHVSVWIHSVLTPRAQFTAHIPINSATRLLCWSCAPCYVSYHYTAKILVHVLLILVPDHGYHLLLDNVPCTWYIIPRSRASRESGINSVPDTLNQELSSLKVSGTTSYLYVWVRQFCVPSCAVF